MIATFTYYFVNYDNLLQIVSVKYTMHLMFSHWIKKSCENPCDNVKDFCEAYHF